MTATTISISITLTNCHSSLYLTPIASAPLWALSVGVFFFRNTIHSKSLIYNKVFR